MNKVGNMLLSAVLCLSMSAVSAIAQTKTAPAETKTKTEAKGTKTETKTETKGSKSETKGSKAETKSEAKSPKPAKASPANQPTAMEVKFDAPKTVKAGEKATISVTTDPGANVSIEMKLKSGASKSADLKPVKADSSGNAKWEWNVSKNTSAGDVPFTITAKLKRKTATASGTITIQK